MTSLASAGDGYCALLPSTQIECWGEAGGLGDGSASNSAFPVQVKGVGGAGALSGVSNLVGGADYCAVLTSGGADCWGGGNLGTLGNGTFSSATTPVQVEGVGGTGTLSGVSTLTSDGNSFCAVLTSGGVDCWGYGGDGDLGDGQFYTTGNEGSDVPVVVKGVGGTGPLSGVASISGDGKGYCALISTGGVDCWGSGVSSPVQMTGVGGSGTLSAVSSLTGGNGSTCALLTSREVDCWGSGSSGQLGNGQFYTSSPYGSASSRPGKRRGRKRNSIGSLKSNERRT